jgi:hypothetical protein
MAENAGNMAHNSQNPGFENESIRPLQIAGKQGGTMITCCICWENKMRLPWMRNCFSGLIL